jgi:hypothetical protein
LTATRELVVPTIEKQYLVQNNTTGAQSITVKTAAGTGITIPNGSKMHLYVDGVNVIDAVSRFSSLTLGAALPVLSGGTGTTTPSLVAGTNVTITGTWPNQTVAASGGGGGGMPTGAGGDTVFYENGLSVTTTYSIPSNRGAMSTGPITIQTGATVTIPSGSRWVIL